MRIDPNGHVPIYLQIVDGVRHAVARGVFRAGEALPSVRDMGLKLGVNPNTVQRAYEELEREGLIEARRGLGMYVQTNGLHSAQTQTKKDVAAAFDHAVALSRAADLRREAVQRCFEDSMERAFPRENKR